MQKLKLQIAAFLLSFALAFFGCCKTADAAGEFVFKYGVQFGIPNSPSFTEVKLFSVAYQNHLSIFVYQFEGGIIADSAENGSTRQSGGFGNASIGIEVTPIVFPIYASALWGPAFVTNPDSMLSSYFEV